MRTIVDIERALMPFARSMKDERSFASRDSSGSAVGGLGIAAWSSLCAGPILDVVIGARREIERLTDLSIRSAPAP